MLTVNRIAKNYGMLSYLTERISGWKNWRSIIRKYHNIQDHTSEESYQDISMLQKPHSGKGMTINEIINAGYWIINYNSAVKSLQNVIPDI